MNQYIKDKHIINATEKAYNVIYKEKGYIPYKQLEEKKEEADDISKLKKEELLKIAVENGIEVPENATKEIIITLIKQLEEKKEEADE